MEGTPPYYMIKLFVIITLSYGSLFADSNFDQQIQRSKRDVDDASNEIIGDALYDETKDSHIVDKREEIPIPSVDNPEDRDTVSSDTSSNKDTTSSTNTESASSNDTVTGKSDSNTNNTVTSDKEKLKELSSNLKGDDKNVDNIKTTPVKTASNTQQGVKKSTRHHKKLFHVLEHETKDEAPTEAIPTAEEEAKLLQGMDPNVDHPIVDTDLIKKYDETTDTEHGEMMGVSDDKRDTIMTVTDLSRTQKPLDSVNVPEQSFFQTLHIANSNFNSDRLRFIEKRDDKAPDNPQDSAPSHFQVDDKSADLEINANSAGVKVKAKPASLQVVSRPGAHGQPPLPFAAAQPVQSVPVPLYHDVYREPIEYHHHHPHHHHHRHHRRHHHHHHPHEVGFILPTQPFITSPMLAPMSPEVQAHGMLPHFMYTYPQRSDRGYGCENGCSGFPYSYARSMFKGGRDVNAYGRSTVETALDPRLGAPTAANGFNSGIAMPDQDGLYFHNLPTQMLDERERMHQAHLVQLQESALRHFADAQAEKARDDEIEAHKYNNFHRFHSLHMPPSLHNDETSKSIPSEDDDLNRDNLPSALPALSSESESGSQYVSDKLPGVGGDKIIEDEAQEHEPKGAFDHFENKERYPDGEEPGRFIPELPEGNGVSEFGPRNHHEPDMEQMSHHSEQESPSPYFKRRYKSTKDVPGKARFGIPTGMSQSPPFSPVAFPEPSAEDTDAEGTSSKNVEQGANTLPEVHGDYGAQTSEQEEAAKEDKEFERITRIQEQMFKKLGGLLPLGDVPRPDLYPSESSKLDHHQKHSEAHEPEEERRAEEEREEAPVSHIERKPNSEDDEEEETNSRGYKKDQLPSNSSFSSPQNNTSNNPNGVSVTPDNSTNARSEKATINDDSSTQNTTANGDGHAKDNSAILQDPKSHDVTIEVSKSKSLNFDSMRKGVKLSTDRVAAKKSVLRPKHSSEVTHKVQIRSLPDVETANRKQTVKTPESETEKQGKGSKKNTVIVNRPPVIYHPPPEIYHRPAIVLHRPPILIQRPSIVYHQPPVVVHRPAVVYKQPPLVFHQPPPVVNQPLLQSHDAWMPVASLSHLSSNIEKAGVWTGIPNAVGWDKSSETIASGVRFGKGEVDDLNKGDVLIQPIQTGTTDPSLTSGVIPTDGSSITDLGKQNMGMVASSSTDALGTQAVALNQLENTENDESGGNAITEESEPQAQVSSQEKISAVGKTARKSQIHDKKVKKGKKSRKKQEQRVKKHSKIRRSVESVGNEEQINVTKKDVVANETDSGKEKKGTKKDVVVNRPPIIYHPPPEIYHRPDIVIHRPPIVIHRPPIIYHQPPVIVHRPAVVYHQPPIIFHQPPPAVQQPLLYSHDTFVVHPSFVAQHLGSILRTAHHYIGPPRLLTHMGEPLFQGLAGQLEAESNDLHNNLGSISGGTTGVSDQTQNEIAPFENNQQTQLTQSQDETSQFDTGNIQPTIGGSMGDSMVSGIGGSLGGNMGGSVLPTTTNNILENSQESDQVPSQLAPVMDTQSNEVSNSPSQEIFKRSFIGEYKKKFRKRNDTPKKKHHRPKVEGKKQELGSKRQFFNSGGDCGENCDSDNNQIPAGGEFEMHGLPTGVKEVVLHRPGVIYHPPPEIVHRPNIVIHRAPLLIHRPPIVVHQPPVIVHRPPVYYKQPDVVFHTQPPIIHQNLLRSHDFFHVQPKITHVGSHVTNSLISVGLPNNIQNWIPSESGKRGSVDVYEKSNNELPDDSHEFDISRPFRDEASFHQHILNDLHGNVDQSSHDDTDRYQVHDDSDVDYSEHQTPSYGENSDHASRSHLLGFAHSASNEDQGDSFESRANERDTLTLEKSIDENHKENIDSINSHALLDEMDSAHERASDIPVPAVEGVHVREMHMNEEEQPLKIPDDDRASEHLERSNIDNRINEIEHSKKYYKNFLHDKNNSYVNAIENDVESLGATEKDLVVGLQKHPLRIPWVDSIPLTGNALSRYLQGAVGPISQVTATDKSSEEGQHAVYETESRTQETGSERSSISYKKSKSKSSVHSGKKKQLIYDCNNCGDSCNPNCFPNGNGLAKQLSYDCNNCGDSCNPNCFPNGNGLAKQLSYDCNNCGDSCNPNCFPNGNGLAKQLSYDCNNCGDSCDPNCFPNGNGLANGAGVFGYGGAGQRFLSTPVSVMGQASVALSGYGGSYGPSYDNGRIGVTNPLCNGVGGGYGVGNYMNGEVYGNCGADGGHTTVYRRPSIVLPQPPDVIHHAPVVVHRRPIIVHRRPIVYHQNPIIVHKPPVRVRQAPIVVHPVIHHHRFVTHDVHEYHPTRINYTGIPENYREYDNNPCLCRGKKDCVCDNSNNNYIKKKHIHKPKAEKAASRSIPSPSHSKKHPKDSSKRCFSCGDDCDPSCSSGGGPGRGGIDGSVGTSGSIGPHVPIDAVGVQGATVSGFEGGATVGGAVQSPAVEGVGIGGNGPSQSVVGYDSPTGDTSGGVGVNEEVQVGYTGIQGNSANFVDVARPGSFPSGPSTSEYVGTSIRHAASVHVGDHNSHDTTVYKRPDIVVPQPPDIIHRPDIVIHRGPIVVHRRPVVYHQAPVVVHKPPVVVHQAPIVVHPVVHHHRVITHHVHDYHVEPVVNQATASVDQGTTTTVSQGGVVSGVNAISGENVISGSNALGAGGGIYQDGNSGGCTCETVKIDCSCDNNVKKASVSKTKTVRSLIPKVDEKRNKVETGNLTNLNNSSDSIFNSTAQFRTGKKKKKDVVVSRPPIIYHPPPEIYHRPDIVVHRPPLLIHRPSIIYHQPPVIVHRPAVVYHQPPLVFHQPPPAVQQPLLVSHDTFRFHPSAFYTHMGSVVNKVGSYVGVPHGPIVNYPHSPFYGTTGYGPAPPSGYHGFGNEKVPYADPESPEGHEPFMSVSNLGHGESREDGEGYGHLPSPDLYHGPPEGQNGPPFEHPGEGFTPREPFGGPHEAFLGPHEGFGGPPHEGFESRNGFTEGENGFAQHHEEVTSPDFEGHRAEAEGTHQVNFEGTQQGNNAPRAADFNDD